MREIKFRAWDKFNKVMAYSDKNYPLSEYKIEFNLGNENKLSLMKLIDARYGEFRTFDADIMQYTGLKDKNGKEIFEGDIVKLYSTETDKLGSENYTITYTKDAEWSLDVFYLLSRKYHYCEIIGNIYENKDLLND